MLNEFEKSTINNTNCDKLSFIKIGTSLTVGLILLLKQLNKMIMNVLFCLQFGYSSVKDSGLGILPVVTHWRLVRCTDD